LGERTADDRGVDLEPVLELEVDDLVGFHAWCYGAGSGA
jgi:hypothetical protein